MDRRMHLPHLSTIDLEWWEHRKKLPEFSKVCSPWHKRIHLRSMKTDGIFESMASRRYTWEAAMNFARTSVCFPLAHIQLECSIQVFQGHSSFCFFEFESGTLLSNHFGSLHSFLYSLSQDHCEFTSAFTGAKQCPNLYSNSFPRFFLGTAAAAFLPRSQVQRLYISGRHQELLSCITILNLRLHIQSDTEMKESWRSVKRHRVKLICCLSSWNCFQECVVTVADGVLALNE